MPMETSEILKKVRKIEIKSRGLSQHIFAGQYHSACKGIGMAFSEVREYQFGGQNALGIQEGYDSVRPSRNQQVIPSA